MYQTYKFFSKLTKYPNEYVGLEDSGFDVVFIDFTLPLHSQNFPALGTKKLSRQQLNVTSRLDQLRSFKPSKRSGSKIHILPTNLGKHWP